MNETRQWVRLHKDGDTMAISTNCRDEREFISRLSECLDSMIAAGHHLSIADGKVSSTDWAFQFDIWLPQVVEIVLHFRGYKADVHKESTIVAGYGVTSDVVGSIER